jgi:hypothetical protein
MPYIDRHGNLVDKPQGVLQGYSFDGFFGGIITFIVAFFQSLFAPLLGLRNRASPDIPKAPKRGGGDWRPPGGGGGGGGGRGGGNRRFGRLNNSSMDMSSCPTSGG